MRVLIADDSAVDRIMLRRVIEGLGHECLVASTGKEAWELYQAQGADVLISDWMMPGLNGPELCRRVRSLPGASYTYVILLTVLDDHEHTRHGMQAGADDYLRKPLQIHELELRLINAERVVTLHRRLSRRDEEREQSLERHETLLRLAERIVGETDAEQLLNVLLREATDLTGGSAGEISLWDEPASSLVTVRSSLGSADDVASAAHLAAERAAQRQAPLILDGPQLRAAPGQAGIGALATPLLHDDRLLGALAVVSGTHQFTTDDADVLHRLATIGAAGLVSLSRGRGSGTPIAAGQANEPPPGHPPADLPAVPTSLIGREAELDQLEAELRRVGSALLTLTGPAGVGKTRLALALAARAARWLADGVFFVDLTPLRDADAVISAIAQTLRAPAPSGIEDVQRAIGERQLLLIIDNFEHLLPAAAVVRQLLAACPSLKVLVTSRASLRLRGEQLYPVRPLAVPPLDESLTPEAAQRSPAVTLFLERARAVQPGFALTDANAAAVATICARLDGLPLAIELAAARSSVLAPDAMVSRLEYPLRLLTGAEQDRPARHQTLREAITWSYALLRPDEQRAFRQLGVFAGDFSLEAAAAIWSAVAPDAQQDVLDTIGGLLDNSLLYRHSPMSEAPRFRLLETIRQYALEQLEASGELQAARHAHAAFFLTVAEQAGPELRCADQSMWLGRLDREQANLLAALEYIWETGSAELTTRFAAALADFWEIRAFLVEGETWLERARELGASLTGLSGARVLSGLTRLALARGDRPVAAELAEATVSAWRELDDPNRLAEALADLALVRTGQAVKSREPRELAREAESLARSGADAATVAHVTHRLGEIAFGQGWFAGAQGLFRESTVLALRAGDQWRAASGLEGLAVVASAQRRSELALRLAGAAAALRERLRAPLPPALLALFDRRLNGARAELGDEAVALAWEEGRVLPVEELIGSFEDPSSPSLPPEQTASVESRRLTPREREVAALVALGLRNYDIAQQLGISRKTAEVHVANVLDKLGMTSRVQLASWALREGLLQQAQP